tara:strand:- start:336 stop:494 length:159 start_codon:yes stop_codon:yes gene_type:complete
MTDAETAVIVETQLNNIASILNGDWRRVSVLHSNRDAEDQIIITFNKTTLIK